MLRAGSAPEDGRNHRPKHVELIGIINKPLLLHLVGCTYYFFELFGVPQEVGRKNALCGAHQFL
jgi:hypothetical protein